jgi:molybdopterin molybdotransferase
LQLIGAALSGRALPAERVDLYAAAGRIAASDVGLAHALPPFAQAGMDGYAVRYEDLATADELRVIGVARAGKPFLDAAPPRSAVRIATGAALPAAFDTVVVDEHCLRNGDRLALRAIPRRGANVRAAGDDVPVGHRLVARGDRLDAARLAMLASAGAQPVRVFARPRIALLGVGDELLEPGQRPESARVYQCNNALLQALVENCGGAIACRERLPDDPAQIADSLNRLAPAVDLILSSGGVSVSEFDPLPPLLAREAQIHFWKLDLKPGFPTLFAEWRGTPMLALPGNSASVFTLFHLLVKPMLAQLSGLRAESEHRLQLPLRTAILKSHPREEVLRAIWTLDPKGAAQVEPLAQEPFKVGGLHRVNALIHLPAGAGEWAVGSRVEVERL